MKTRYTFGIVLLMMGMFAPLQAQTYDSLWKEVERLGEEKDLPQSALAETMKIYEKAKKVRNVPQMMKAYLTAMQYRTLLSPDSLEVDVKGLEEWAAQTERAEDKAVLYSIMGEITLADDVKKGFGFLQLSLKEENRLMEVSAGAYSPMTEWGTTSVRYFQDNLYDLLSRRAIQLMQQYRWKAASKGNQMNSLPMGVDSMEQFMTCRIVPESDCDFTAATLQIYQSLLKAYDTDAVRAAWLLTGIDALTYLYRSFSSCFTNERCRQELNRWIGRYGGVEVTPEVYQSLAELLQESGDKVECLRVVREGIAKYPHYEGINRLKNMEADLLRPSLTLNVDTVYPGEEQELKVTYKNLSRFTLQLYKVELPVTSVALQNRGKDFENRYATLQREEHFALEPTADCQVTDTVLTIQAPQSGIYLLKAVADGNKETSDGVLMYVTALRAVYRPLPDGKTELLMVDAMSGHPVEGAELVTYVREKDGYRQEQVWPADERGTVRLDFLKNRNVYYQVRTLADTAMPITNLRKSNYSYTENGKSKEVLQLFTDRSLYRPGQIVYMSGLAYQMLRDDVKVLTDKIYTVSLYDANNKEVGKIEVKTNEFGSFSGQFALPSSCLNGNFRLKAGNASATFKVEGYKRPSFEVVFEPMSAAYRAGDSIRVTGVATTFAGASVQQAKVRYQITRSISWFRHTNKGRVAQWEGETVTDAEGKFQVPVRFETDSEQGRMWYYTYKVTVNVTNGAGETQQGSLSLPLGTTSVVLTVDHLPVKWLKEDRTKIKFPAMNLSGELVDTEIACQVIRLEEQKEEKSVWKETVVSNQEFVPESVYALPSGSYRLKLSAKDAQGRECTASHDFVLFSLDDNRPPVKTADWFYQTGKAFGDTIYIGSSENVYLLYDVFAGRERIESRQLEFSDSIVAFRFPYKDEYGDGITVSLAFVKNKRLYMHTVQLVKPEPQKELHLKWTSFRDKLRPGQQEEWRLSVLYPDGRPAEAELLATLYDASLDKLYRPHTLPFGLKFYRPVPSTRWSMTNVGGTRLYVNFPQKRLEYPVLEYSTLLVPYRKYAMFETARVRSMNVMAKGTALVADAAGEEDAIELTLGEAETNEMEDDIQVREDFAETAFFYPQLRADENGEVSLSFTLPESLTRWKFLGLAHTRNLDYGRIEAEAVASKEFMLQPNMPRFVRVGDRTNVSASLINLSDVLVQGTMRMELFNPETEEILYSQKQSFAVQVGETGNVDFSFDVSDKCTLLACRMVADGDTFSDGEQQYIPVLTDKQWVTETRPLYVDGKGTHTFSIEDLFNNHSVTAFGQLMTVEFTANPVWYAVQALPVVAEPQTENALSWAVAYYANTLAAYIVRSYPRIKQVFDSWLVQGGTKDTFVSNLQKNQELKDILWTETPWLSEAASEEEQKQRVATLFDLNAMDNRLEVSADKLKELQDGNGAWSWYKGMPASRYVTTQVMEMLTRLYALTGAKMNGTMQDIYQKGMQYLGAQAEEEYRRAKESEQNGATHVLPSEQMLKYLYICALDDNAIVKDEVNRYFIDKMADAVAKSTIYGKALGSIILQQNGREEEAQKFMQSLMEYSVVTDEMGRYFDTPKAQYSWFSYKIPTEVAAMEAIQRITGDARIIDEMKRWLLKQKQTQMWETPIATADAVYALLTTGTSDLLASTGSVKISLGKEVIRTPESDAVGYIKQTVSGDVMKIKTMTVAKESEGTGWGAVYAQYWEDLDQMGSQSNALSITRELYKGDEVLDKKTPLHVGDKITIRLTVKADRDMDFVQIKDARASCMEPLETLSGYRRHDGLGYYQMMWDASTLFFVDQMRKGTYVITYQVYVDRAGTYQAGTATVQSAYAPEFSGHTSERQIVVEP